MATRNGARTRLGSAQSHSIGQRYAAVRRGRCRQVHLVSTLGRRHRLGPRLGWYPEPGPALVVACEDDADELHRRLDAIARHYGANFTDLGKLHIVSLAGQD